MAVEEGGALRSGFWCLCCPVLRCGSCAAGSLGVAQCCRVLSWGPILPSPQVCGCCCQVPMCGPCAAWSPGVALEESSFYSFCLIPLFLKLIRSTFCYISELLSLRTVILLDFISNILRSIVPINIWICTHTTQIWNIFY